MNEEQMNLNMYLFIDVKNGAQMSVGCRIIAGADVNARNDDGYTPLIVAIQLGYRHIVKELLKHGADIYASDNNGKNALDWALYTGHKKIINLLTRK